MKAGTAKVLIAVYVGYLALGKGFAYAGVPPLYIGEVCLGLLAVSVFNARMPIPVTFAAKLTVVFAALGAYQLIYDLMFRAIDPLETVRGFALVYYAAYAFGTYALLVRSAADTSVDQLAADLTALITRLLPGILFALFVLVVLLVVDVQGIPTWPASDTPILFTKATDIGVSLSVLIPFVFSKQAIDMPGIKLSRVIWFATAVLAVTRSRATLLALLAAVIVVYGIRLTLWLKIVGFTTVTFMLLAVSGVRINVGSRELSSNALVVALSSIFSSDQTNVSNYADTRSWRSEWWAQIWNDAISERMVLHAHGWGDNLALRYNVVSQASATDSKVLRLPHSIFFSLVGRVGLVMAVVFFVIIVATVLLAVRRPGTHLGTLESAARAGVVTAVVIGLTDVYIESPQGGIVLWVNVGILWWARSVPALHDVSTQRSGARPISVYR